jgi:hypothetical protein
MPVGAFGMGAGVAVADASGHFTSGLYRVNDNSAGIPLPAWGALLSGGDSVSGGIIGRAYISSATGEMHSQGRQSNTWTDWRKQYDNRNILGTVSQSAGVPTGAIIQRGGNANGQFTRFADGTQDCWAIVETGTTPSAPYGSLFTTSNRNWIYPMAFVDGNVAFFPSTVSGAGGDYTWCGVGDTPIQATNASYRGWRPVSVSLSITVSLLAKGRWY